MSHSRGYEQVGDAGGVAAVHVATVHGDARGPGRHVRLASHPRGRRVACGRAGLQARVRGQCRHGCVPRCACQCFAAGSALDMRIESRDRAPGRHWARWCGVCRCMNKQHDPAVTTRVGDVCTVQGPLPRYSCARASRCGGVCWTSPTAWTTCRSWAAAASSRSPRAAASSARGT